MSARSPVKKGDPAVKKRWRYETPLEHVESPLPDVRGVVGKDNEYLHRNRRIYFSSYAGGWKSLRSRTLPTLRGTHALPPDAHRWRPQARVVHEGYANACWSGALIRAEPMELPDRAYRARERGVLRKSLPLLRPRVEALRSFGQAHADELEKKVWQERAQRAQEEAEKIRLEKEAVDQELKELEDSQPSTDDMLKFVREAAKERVLAFEAASQERARVAQLSAEVAAMRHAVAAEASAEKEAEEDAAEAIRTGRDPAGPAPKAGSAAALRATYKKGPKGAQRAAPVDDLALESKREEAHSKRQRINQLLAKFEFDAQKRCLKALGDGSGAQQPAAEPETS
jgi:hypothetical protein